MPQSNPTCAACPYDWSERFCRNAKGKAPANCPSVHQRELGEQSLAITLSDVRMAQGKSPTPDEIENAAEKTGGTEKAPPRPPEGK